MIKSIAFTAYPVKDMAASRAFYEGLLGLKPAMSIGEHWQEYELGEGTFATVVVGDDAPEVFKSRGASLAFEVEDIEAAYAKLKESGVAMEIELTTFPTCRMFMAVDPSNNAVGFHQLHQ